MPTKTLCHEKTMYTNLSLHDFAKKHWDQYVLKI